MLKAVYQMAGDEVQACAKELARAELPFPDGQEKFKNALKAETGARQAYTQAIQELVDLTEPE
jgi:hypothetical protein